MKCTFGIISCPDTCRQIGGVIGSINAYAPVNYEIIVIGGNSISPEHNLTYIPFDESQKKSWITKKKNIITDLAQYDIIVYMHDYVELMPGWSDGFDDLEPWDVCMSRIFTQNGQRFRDWVAWDDPQFPGGGRIMEKWCPPEGIRMTGSMTIVPYDYTNTQYMYVSGAYWVAKKKFMLEYPLNEDLSWGEGEDVEWSYRARKTWKYKMNTLSRVRFNKPK
jgi:hypothetical protein